MVQPSICFKEEPKQFSMGQTPQSLTCSIMEKPHARLDECPRILLSRFRAGNSACQPRHDPNELTGFGLSVPTNEQGFPAFGILHSARVQRGNGPAVRYPKKSHFLEPHGHKTSPTARLFNNKLVPHLHQLKYSETKTSIFRCYVW